ncbi:ankyrin repeat-containing domain protein, partial [Hypoxylon rubiginosum]
LVSRLLELGANPNAAVRDNQTALEASIYNGHESVTIRLLESGARIERNTLSLALRYGRHQTVMEIMSVDSSLTGQELVWAFRIPNELMLRSFLRSRPCGISASERSPDKRSPLENAILSFDIAVIEFTLSLYTLAYDSGALCAAVLATAQSSVAGMDDILREILRRRELVCDEHLDFDQTLENTAVSIAAYYERIDILLQLHGREGRTIGFAVLPELSLWKWPARFDYLEVSHQPTRFRPKYDDPDISILSFDCCHVSLREWSNWHDGDRWLVSPVFLAVKSQSESVVEALLEQGYRADGHSLKAAIFENFSLSLVKRLAEGCTDINSSETIDMIHPYTPVLLVNFFQDLDLLKILLVAGADPNFGPCQVRAHVLRHLIISGRSELLDVLLQHDIKINDIPSVRSDGNTPLQTAAAMGNLGIMRRLLEKGADPNARRAVYKGSTAIEAAVEHGRLDATQLLLDYGVDTEGPGRFSYVLATYQARQRGLLAIFNILKSHRRWTDDDKRMRREMSGTKIFLHKSEYSEDEIEELTTCIHDLRTRPLGDLIVLLGVKEEMENSCEETENRSEREVPGDISEETDTAATPLESSHISSGPIMTVNQEDGNDTPTISMDAENSHTEALCPILYRETLSPDEFGFADAMFTEVVDDTQEVSNVLVTRFDITEEQTENTQLWPCDEAGESSQRYQQIRDDMLGVREAPFEPIEWAL